MVVPHRVEVEPAGAPAMPGAKALFLSLSNNKRSCLVVLVMSVEDV